MRQSAVILALGWALAPLQFLTAIMVARVLGPDGKGMLAILTGLTAIVASLIGLGMPSGVAAVYHRQPDVRASLIATALSITAATSLLVIGLYFWAGPRILLAIVSQQDLAAFDSSWVLLAVLTVLPTALTAVIDVTLILSDAMRTYSVRAAVSGLLTVVITWVLTLELGWGLTGALVGYAVGSSVGVAVFLHWLARQRGCGGWWISVRSALTLLHVGVQQYAISVIALVSKRIDVFLVASLLSVEQAGFYAAGILVPLAIVIVPRATMWPMVSVLSRTDSRRGSDSVTGISGLQVAVMLLLSASLGLAAPWLVRWLFGEAFLPSTPSFRWALLGVPFTPLTVTVNAILTARGRPGLSILSAAIGTSIQVALAVLLIPRWGAHGGAAALSANFIVTALIQLALVRAQGTRVTALLIPTREDVRLLVNALRARVST